MPAPEERSDPRRTVIAATLRQTRMFADLSSTDLAEVTDACTLRSLQKGELLFRQGDRAEGFYVLQTGQVSIFRVTPDGREQVICVFRPPESFAEVTLATVESYPANAIALEPSQVIVVHRAQFRALINRKPELSLHMLASMSLHLKHLVQLLEDQKNRQIETRLADWILRFSPAAAAGCPASFDLPMTKKMLAAQLGVTSETLSRTFARFRREGLLRVTGPRIHVIDSAGLRAYSEPAF